ncbi:sigma-54-dependent transcriptional regulator [Bacteroidota bacterium]
MIKKEGRILVVDDNENILGSLRQLLKFDFESIKTISNPNRIPELIKTNDYDVILLDMNFSAGINSGNEGIFWIKEILKIDSSAVIILITAYADINIAVKAIKTGGTDFIVKPWDPKKLISTIQSAVQFRKTKMEVKNLKQKQEILLTDIDKQYDSLITSSPIMDKVNKDVEKIAPTLANVLITGDNGTGKELVARQIHRKSDRAEEIFLNVDLGSLSESLFESELFGHKKGSFTDAKKDRAGRFELASGGTLFLDEIGNISIPLQAKLLNVIQNRQVIPVGSSVPIPFDVRIICATNKNLEEMVEKNLFREDLLYRINTLQINLPPLRLRGGDILLLTDYFVKKFSDKYQKSDIKLNEEAYEKLQNHNWPGNIRELKHVIEKAVILCEENVIMAEDFYFKRHRDQITEGTELQRLADIEKLALEKVLKTVNGNLSQAARILDISRTTLYSKMNKHGL